MTPNLSSTSSKRTIAAGFAMLATMAAMMICSAWNDSPTTDDVVSISSGYSYLKKRDYRLEPQNPPLVKDLAALPLVFMPLREPWDRPGWEGESDPDLLGREFLFRIGNDADAIARAAKMPIVVLTLAFGVFFFWWTKNNYGDSVALLALFFYAFSPTFIAHGRSITTDVASVAGFFVATAALVRFLKRPTFANVALAGIAMGFAFLTKFSTIALVPIALGMAVAWAIVSAEPPHKRTLRIRRHASGSFSAAFRLPNPAAFRSIAHYVGLTLAVIAIAYIAIYPIYLFNIWNYSPTLQVSEAHAHRVRYDMHGTARDIAIWASDKALFRPWAEYLLGLLVALKASSWGQPLFFLGKVIPAGVPLYFPFVYLTKEPLPLHILTLCAIVFVMYRAAIWLRARAGEGGRIERLRGWLKDHFTECAMFGVMAIYWTALLRSRMNIGLRHLLPALPFAFVLVAKQIVSFYRGAESSPRLRRVLRIALAALLIWQIVSVARVYPSYLAYFNETVGGPGGGWKYVNDSNLDWGQDFKRLADFLEREKISGIRGEAFGPSDPNYYLGAKYLGPVGCTPPFHGWVALSAMVYSGAPWNPGCDYRRTIPMNKLVAKIGYSIFVFRLD